MAREPRQAGGRPGKKLPVRLILAAVVAASAFGADSAWAAGRVALVVGVSRYEKVTPLV